MKFMKIGTRPDAFFTEDGTRTVISDVPGDLTITINSITYLIHKFPLLPKCGLLQRLCSSAEDSGNIALELHDIPGGEEAFELCAKFCYGITINVSAHNFVPAFCAAKFLRMTEAFERGNLVVKLEAFFASCILEGWKDSILVLQTTQKLAEWAENVGIIRRCIDSIVEKILTPPLKVKWSYTCSRPGYEKSVPKDWWTEDLSVLEIELFRCIITSVRSTNALPPQLIGEALHVYATRWLPNVTKRLPLATGADRKRSILETIVSMIPGDGGSVLVGFLLRLVSAANYLGASMVTKAQLIRRSGTQLPEARLNDLLLPSQDGGSSTCDESCCAFDVELIGVVLDSFLRQWRRHVPGEGENHSLRSIRKVGKLIDTYLQVVARDPKMPVEEMVSLASAVPDIARPVHDELYQAINTYLKIHPDLSKSGKKQLCRILDCQKLSPQVCMHAVKNERLPLRTVVQLLYFEQERGGGTRTTTASELASPSIQRTPTLKDYGLIRRLKLQGSDDNWRIRRGPVRDDDDKAESNSSRSRIVMESGKKGREIVEEGTNKIHPRTQRTVVHKHI
ncbi:PREDICTED: BTB/POZ domain-containing protein At5g47800-like [Ipomoea nil]|uniref:BTB/POZ domain-containing protein At5g47800-like n=1 Tax=Ipomoea nil TaxID=35883 RepID=UPI00090127A9|nr:PREDICTED: BTB/POZ domain-containing protein At5g47800-like [Ipomoea nil]XP_019177096.1 PREDICTED: BTB/POZ domain-containing protein At5g47800-like [Ipomoea nil]